MTNIDGVLLTTLFVIDTLMGAIVEDDTVLQDLTDSGSFVLIGSFQDIHRTLCVGGNGTGEEMSTGTEAQLCGTERILYRAVRTRLRDEATGRGRGVLSFCQTIDTVVEQDHVQVDVTTIGVNEVVAADGKTVTVARHLPYRQVGVCHLRTSGNRCGTSVDGVHTIGCHIVGQTTGASDTTDDCYVLWGYANLCHSLME